MNTKLVRTCIAQGLLAFSSEDKPFPGRKGSAPTEAIVDVRGSTTNLPLRGILLGALAGALADYPATAVIGGVSRGGVAYGAMLALVAGCPFVSILPEGPRPSGLRRAVEGEVRGQNVVLFDNVVTSGSSLIAAAKQVTEAGGTVAGALVVCAYQPTVSLPFPLTKILEFHVLIHTAHEAGKITTAQLNHMTKGPQ